VVSMGTGTAVVRATPDACRQLGGTGVGGRPPPTSGGSATGHRPQNDLDVVPTGKLTAVPQARDIFAGFAVLSPLRFHFPPYAEYATAVGATLSP